MLKIGDRAPDFSLPDQAGEVHRLSGLVGTTGLILYFYPADFTPICTRQACLLKDIHEELSEAGLKVIGISPQSVSSHDKFATRYQLPFTLLADPDKQTIRAYGCLLPIGLGVRRRSFLIDADRNIRDILTADLMVGQHQAFARNARMALQGNQD